ncbi:alpha/beta hydrolase [Sphingomonas yabuuchiae]|uniref:Alpha/beta hydrolase n=1 Tax=Sphingomonas yabuuchiae TaxID=172044 RepID=A0A147IX34_9SPHN|nr:alpha/beta hydrolase [Sphingomonas yabuuchiae]KTW00299.1 alpha/beta hydrolase [Sphingomonas yabuuchiae]
MTLFHRIARSLPACLSLLVAGCSPLATFDRLVPKDSGGRRVAEALSYGSDARQRLDIYAPRTAGTGGRPVVVFFYGGSWNSGTRSGYAFVGRALAAQGFVVVIPDYRLVPAIRYPAFVEDGAAAMRWTKGHVAEFGGDPAKLVLMGHSAGAYIAAMLAVDDRWLGRDRQAVRGLVGLAGPYDFAPFDVDVSRAAFGAWPRPEETQPVHWAGAGDPPALLLVGADDKTVLPRNSEALAARLQAGGVPVTLRAYPKLGHVGMILSVARPFRGRAPVVADVAAFVRQVTR